MKNLVLLVPDKDIEYTLKGVLARHQALGIRQIEFDCFAHPEHDPGCLRTSESFLRPLLNRYEHALVLFDREGCGKEQLSRDAIEQEVESRLSLSGWADRAKAIVLDPEIEIWVWSDSPHVDKVLGWENRQPDLRTWLQGQNFLSPGQLKPQRPKEAMQSALRNSGKSRSSALFFQLAENVSLTRCVDPAFLKLKTILQQWFVIHS
ncbi:MAG: hypothetical protein JNK38_03280 [Acidobacteria bacterium]|nr:hypothetical protein [Acidobacteriota bacterium]